MTPTFSAQPESLTSREREVLALLVQGHSTKEAGFDLGITLRTADAHRRNAYAKLGIHSRGELFALVYSRELHKVRERLHKIEEQMSQLERQMMSGVTAILLCALLFASVSKAAVPESQCDPENAFQQCFMVPALADDGFITVQLKAENITAVFLNGKALTTSTYKLIVNERQFTGAELANTPNPMAAFIRTYILVIYTKKRVNNVVDVRYSGYDAFQKLLNARVPAGKTN